MTRDLQRWVDVPVGAILHQVAMSKEDPNTLTTLWVARDAAVISRTAPAPPSLAALFTGGMARSAGLAPYQPSPLGAAAAVPMAGAGPGPAAALQPGVAAAYPWPQTLAFSLCLGNYCFTWYYCSYYICPVTYGCPPATYVGCGQTQDPVACSNFGGIC